VFVAVIVIMLACLAVLLITINEPKLAKLAAEESKKLGIDVDTKDDSNSGDRKMSSGEKCSLIFLLASVFLWFFGYNAITTAFSKYARIYWGLEGGLFAYALIVAQAAALIAFIPVGIFASKFGRKRIILIGITLLTISFASGALFKEFSPIVLALFAMAGIGWASINVNSYPMVVEMSKGSNVGKYTGFYYTFSMLSQVLTPIFSGFLMQHVGYHILFPYGAVFAALSFLTMLMVRHGDSKPDRIKGIEAFDSDD